MTDLTTLLARGVMPALHDGTTTSFMFKRAGRFNDTAYEQEAERFAAAILATPEGQALAALVEAALALEVFMRVEAALALEAFTRAPDTDPDGEPADWAPGFDAIGELYAAIDHYREVTK